MSPLATLLSAGAADQRPFLQLAARSWSRAELLAQADGLAALLAARGLKPGEALGIALPNLAATVAAVLAAWRGGFLAAPLDPRQPVSHLLDWQAALRPPALVTLDLATVFERTRPLLADSALRIIPVARMADELAPLPRLLAPWLRAGGSVKGLSDVRAFAWNREPGAPPTSGVVDLRLPDGTVLAEAALAALATPRADRPLLAVPLATRAGLGALLGAWAGGGALVLSPRLDARALAKAAKQAGTTERVAP